MKKKYYFLGVSAIFAIVSFVSVNQVFSEGTTCYRSGKEKVKNEVHYCPHEDGTGPCYYLINCDDSVIGGVGGDDN